MAERHESWVSGLKWSGLRELLLDLAAAYSLTYRTIEETKGLLRTTIQYSVEGEPANIQGFRAAMIRSLRAYNDS